MFQEKTGFSIFFSFLKANSNGTMDNKQNKRTKQQGIEVSLFRGNKFTEKKNFSDGAKCHENLLTCLNKKKMTRTSVRVTVLLVYV